MKAGLHPAVRQMMVRLQTRAVELQPDSPRVTATLTEIGLLVSAYAKANVRDRRMVNSGDLLRSINYRVEASKRQAVLRVGSFGVPYAAIHEYGGEFRADMRAAMFANLRARGKTWTPKGVIYGPPGARRFPSRPYLRDAVRKARPDIVTKLRSILAGK